MKIKVALSLEDTLEIILECYTPFCILFIQKHNILAFSGVMQGDPLFPYWFTLYAETLSILIKQNTTITGIRNHETEYLVPQNASMHFTILWF